MKRQKTKPTKKAAPRKAAEGRVIKKQTFTIDGPGDRMRVVFAAPY